MSGPAASSGARGLFRTIPRLSAVRGLMAGAMLVSIALAPGHGAHAADKPNFLLIVADDMGFSDMGSFGGEVRTPNLDKLASVGVRYTNFYTAQTCSPTRSMLMSGTDNHLAGMGNMYERTAPNQMGQPGYEGFLNFAVAALPEILHANGYHTYMTGKWHLGKNPEHIPAARGFERDFTMLDAAGAHFSRKPYDDANDETSWTEDGHYIDKLPKHHYSSTTFTNKIIEYIESNRSDGKPWFAYVSHMAPHDPLQVPDPWLRKYKGAYDDGWDEIRARRLERMKEIGILPKNANLAPRVWYVPDWEELTGMAQVTLARKMEIYAAVVEYMDMEIGRLVRYLRDTGQLENTYIVFFSDNGPESDDKASNYKGKRASAFANWLAKTYDTDFASWGRKGSFVAYGAPWAQVSATPFWMFKGTTNEGGIRAPLIVVTPDRVNAGQINGDAVLHVMDDYDRFILDPVLVYFHDSSRASAVDPQELMELTSALGEEVAQELADGGYQVVKSPGPGVLRIRAAITDVDAARPGVNVAAKAAGALTLGQAFFVPAVDIGRASIEAEMRDATTGERVAVFVDARKGKRFGSTIASTRKWAHAKDAFKVWAQRLRHRLDTVHAQGDGDR